MAEAAAVEFGGEREVGGRGGGGRGGEDRRENLVIG